MPCESVAAVAVEDVPYAADIFYEYLIPEDLRPVVAPGTLVLCPLGASNRTVRGVVAELRAPREGKKLKPLRGVYDVRRYIDRSGLRLAAYIKNKTLCTYFDAVRLMVPAGVLGGLDRYFSLTDECADEELRGYFDSNGNRVPSGKARRELSRGLYRRLLVCVQDGRAVETLKTSGASAAEVNVVSAVPGAAEAYAESLRSKNGSAAAKHLKVVQLLLKEGPCPASALSLRAGVSDSVIKTLAKRGIVTVEKKAVRRDPFRGRPASVSDRPVALTDEQRRAYEQICSRLGSGRAHLLYGVTGSGKTLVYLKLIDRVLAEGRTVLLLVPEITLTLQTVDILRRRYGSDEIAVLHSGLSTGERFDEWQRIKRGDCRLVIGTRSAVFAPLKNIGIIIIDEEQEHTYKSEMTPKYSAAEVAAFIVREQKGLLLLASATPSFETFFKARSGAVGFSEITHRYNGRALPRVLVSDMTQELLAGNRSCVSAMLADEISRNLKNGEQTILFMNRRGYSSYVSCPKCKYVYTCPSCGIPLTYHRTSDRLVCHYCGYSLPRPQTCRSCSSPTIRYSGIGTQKAQEQLSALFPEARVVRMDADTVSGKDSRDRMLSDFRDKKYDILLGTQMITKGLDFPDVTLVGVMMADSLLYSSDFRAYEKTFAILTQVVGRAGRADKSGRAVVQTYSPTHPVLRFAFEQDYVGFYEQETALRNSLVYPPFCDICQAVFLASAVERAFEGAQDFIDYIRESVSGQEYGGIPVSIIKPKQTAVPMVGGRHRVRVLIKCRDCSATRAMISAAYVRFVRDVRHKDVAMSVDMNPAVIV